MKISERSIAESIQFVVDSYNRCLASATSASIISILHEASTNNLSGIRLVFDGNQKVLALIGNAQFDIDKSRDSALAVLTQQIASAVECEAFSNSGDLPCLQQPEYLQDCDDCIYAIEDDICRAPIGFKCVHWKPNSGDLARPPAGAPVLSHDCDPALDSGTRTVRKGQGGTQ